MFTFQGSQLIIGLSALFATLSAGLGAWGAVGDKKAKHLRLIAALTFVLALCSAIFGAAGSVQGAKEQTDAVETAKRESAQKIADDSVRVAELDSANLASLQKILVLQSEEDSLRVLNASLMRSFLPVNPPDMVNFVELLRNKPKATVEIRFGRDASAYALQSLLSDALRRAGWRTRSMPRKLVEEREKGVSGGLTSDPNGHLFVQVFVKQWPTEDSAAAIALLDALWKVNIHHRPTPSVDKNVPTGHILIEIGHQKLF